MSSNSIINYATKLLPTFRKDRLTEDARMLETELNTNTIPSYKFSESIFNRSTKSKEILDYQKTYFSILGGSNQKGMVSDISNRLENILKTVTFIATAAEKNFETSIVVDGITLYKVSLIKSLELCGFISRYSLRLLNYFYVLEAAATSKDNSYVSKELSKGDIKELEKFLPDFCRAIKSLSKDPKDFEKELAKLPDVTVGPMSEATLANVGSAKLDPINIFSMNGFISPIYRIGMMVANYQVSRYKEAVELKTNLELRKIFLEGLQANGQADAVVQKEIEIIQSRIDNCAEQIRKEEEKVGM